MDISLDSFLGLLAFWADGLLSLRLYVALVLAGLVLVGIGLIMRHLMRGAIGGDSIPVTLKVVAVHQEAIRGREDRVTWRPEFEVTEGPHKGLRKASETTSSPPIHAAGDIERGWYNPATGDLESRSVLATGRKVIKLCYAGGAGLVALGVLGLAML